jgi:hypothetical protein
MLALFVALQSRLPAWPPPRLRRRQRDEAGQATAEYAIVLLAAAGIALLLMKWAKSTLIGKLLDSLVDLVLGKIT